MRSLTRALLPLRFRAKPLVRQDAEFASAQTGGEATQAAEANIRIDTGGRLKTAARKADPAPSRLSYRLQRWMLTPGIRLGLRVGVPFCLCIVIGSGFLASEKRRDALNDFVADVRASIQERPEFMVNLMAIDGAGTSLAEDIREVVPLDFPVSSFDLDVEQIRKVITGLDPVKTATVRIRPGGILQVNVTERQPVVVWRTRYGVAMLDETGAHVDELPSRATRPDLPLIVGKGADDHVRQALQVLRVSAPLSRRVRGLVRVGERRWDLVLDRDQLIQLPVERPVQALERVLAVNEVQELLDRDIAVVDMRIAARPTIRMTEVATAEWWRTRTTTGGNGQ